MHILITNDDGVTAPGLLALVQELRGFGRVSVLAPDRNWSASGHVKTLERPLRVKEVVLANGAPALASDGAPSDCVALAMLGVIPEKIDVVVSGINPGGNFGYDVTYSGTVTAAMEGAIWGRAGIAVSIDLPYGYSGPVDFGPAARAARAVVEQVMAHSAPAPVLLNVNVPFLPDEQIRGYAVTRQGLRVYRDALVRREDPRGKPYYWIGGDVPTGVPEAGTDFGAIEAGYISITPLQLDMTAAPVLDAMRAWTWNGRPAQP